jgi:hypothetical protein
MATSGSLERRKEQKPESVHFWLAIVAGSLFFHSVFMFGVSRAVKVAVAEPGGGAIDVEFVEASGSKAAPEGEPIVPASSFKPEPFRPEPTPLPEFTPEPIVKPEEKPIVKPEVREEKPPIVKPEVKKPIVSPPETRKKTEPKANVKKPVTDPSSGESPLVPPGETGTGTGIKGIKFGAIGTPKLTQYAKTQAILDGKMGLPSIDSVAVDPSFPLRPGQVVELKLTLTIDNATGSVIFEDKEALTIEGDWTAGLNLTENQQFTVLETVKNRLLSIKFPLPKITINGGAKPSESSEWLISFQLIGQ